MAPGGRNAISDVEGVLVGHCTLDEPERGVHTGVTVIVPASGSLFREKLPAAVSVFNGFGKSVGLVQIGEKGTLETPIVLTGVSSVGVMFDALFRREMGSDAGICREDGSVNPVVCECNDSFLNDARAARLSPEHLEAAFASASPDFEEGAVGAGRGMSCFQLKGGIGSASRIIAAAPAENTKKTFTVGVLTLANFGRLPCLTAAGRGIGPSVARRMAGAGLEERLEEAEGKSDFREHGSIVIVAATDAPLDARQLKRLARRSFIGVGRAGAFAGDGSGDIAVAFSTARRIPHASPESGIVVLETLHEDHIDPFFQAAAEATEEAILNALVTAAPLRGRDGNERRSLKEFLAEILRERVDP
jgi:D-aminopeptidase